MTSVHDLIVRVDADAKMGAGHLMRCFALAQEWRDNGRKVVFVTACKNEDLLDRLSDERFQVIRLTAMYPDPTDAKATVQVLLQHPGAWLVLDGYHFDESYQEIIQKSGVRLLLFDDDARQNFYHADVVLNQNIYADLLKYECQPKTRLLLGMSYTLLRNEFITWQKRPRYFLDEACKFLITFGDGDSTNQSIKAVLALQQVPIKNIEAIVVAGSHHPRLAELQFAVSVSKIPIQIVRNVRNFPELMTWADMAISAGGSTCWEFAYMGLPSLLIVTAENQKMAMNALAHQKIARIVENANVNVEDLAHQIESMAKDKKNREQMSIQGRSLSDGLGRRRVVDALLAKREPPERRAHHGL